MFMAVNIVTVRDSVASTVTDTKAESLRKNSVDSFLDTLSDERMERVYPNAIAKE